MSKILIIDDDNGVLESLRLVLENAGHSVICATDGRKGLAMAQSDAFDIVITDLIMPDIDGLEIIRQVRQRLPDAKILAISGGGSLSSNVYLNLADRFGADITLPKPLSKSDLLTAIASLQPPAT